MTDYTWVGGTSATASTAANWSPSGVPNSSSHTATFANAVACNWDIAACGILHIKEGYTGIVTLQNAVALTGLKVDVKETIDAGAARIITFSGTPPYNSGKSHIYYNDFSTDDSPFRNAAARAYVTFTMNGSSRITYDSGVYPHILLTNGSHTPDYATITGTRENKINFLSLTVNSGATFAPASATPSANDRLRKWVSDTAAQSQFAISSGVATFNGGYAEWTFQAISSGFTIPTSGTTTYNQCKFTFDKMVLDASVGGVGKWAKITAATRLSLNDLTINTGASLKGSHDTIGCAIFLVNKPTIHGTWAFLPFADGMYVYPKTGETLGYVDGGTGLNALGSANQVLATNAGATAMEWQTVSSGSGDITGVSITTDTGAGSKAEDTAGSADFSILGTAGVGVTNSGVTITATAVPGEIDHDSLQNFVANEHLDWTASVGTIHAGNYTDTNTQLSNAQVRTAVEAATDSNVFTDADHTKLNGVEASADVTDSRILQSEEWGDDNAVGWWTFAVIKGRDAVGNGQRGQAQFYIQETDSSRHRTARIEVGHHFGKVGANFITLLGASGYGNELSFTDFRIKNADTYDGAVLQIYISNATNNLQAHMMMNLGASYGWVLLDTILADSNTSGHNSILGYAAGTFANFADSFSVDKTLDIEETGIVDANAGGGIATTGGLAVDGAARITGNITAGGTVDGRDLATDGGKLDGIEALADVTDATNVAAAGAVMGGTPISSFPNDAGYLTAATTPTGTWGRWESTANYDDKDENVNHLMLVDDSSNFTKTGTLAGFSSGTFTATAATAGTYIVYAQAQYGIASTNAVPETSGLKYQAQLLIYHGSNMEGFGRYLRNGFWADEHYCTTTVVTLADGEELEVYYKLNDPNTSEARHFKLKNGGGSPATYIMMVKIA